MRVSSCVFLIALLGAGCFSPESRNLKHPDPPVLEAGWGKWDRPEFSIAAPENWSPYVSRVQQQVPPPEGEPPSDAKQWTIIDKDGDEILIENLGKRGIPLRLFDNADRNAQGICQAQLTIQMDASDDKIDNEVEKYKKELGESYKSDEKLTLPVGNARLFRSATNEARSLTFLLINGDARFLAKFDTTGEPAQLEPLARKIMETFRAKY